MEMEWFHEHIFPFKGMFFEMMRDDEVKERTILPRQRPILLNNDSVMVTENDHIITVIKLPL